MTLNELKGQFYLSDPSSQPKGVVLRAAWIVFSVVVFRSGPERIGFLPSLCTHVLFLPASPAFVPRGPSEYSASLGTNTCTHGGKAADAPAVSVVEKLKGNTMKWGKEHSILKRIRRSGRA